MEPTYAYRIISDYLGTPVEAYDEEGKRVWSAKLDIYGRVEEFIGEQEFIPFRYQGQYEDVEIGLYYNRFRYYDPEQGNYTQIDPIGFAGNNPTLYGYVYNPLTWIDPFGLKSNSAALGASLGPAPVGGNFAAHHIVMAGKQNARMKSLITQMKNHGINPDGKLNGIWLPVRDNDKVVGEANTSHQQDGLHGKDYKDELFNRLNGKGKKEFNKELKQLKKELHKGRTWDTKTTKH
ncbi:RHS repeat-associated core domain-containing protein [Solibacillus sp. FSL K6-1523]|uniref:RHS repeat-associated core domain-containing protein n=1 Tax=Solibacillus sp. FSL K6-1523 TaxID=2921471 RepID=UPI0030F5CEDC